MTARHLVEPDTFNFDMKFRMPCGHMIAFTLTGKATATIMGAAMGEAMRSFIYAMDYHRCELVTKKNPNGIPA